MLRTRTTTAGFTLVEVLVALAIFGIVIAQAFAVFGAQHVTYHGTERTLEVQQDSRLLADAVLLDLRMSGYMVPRSVGVSSGDGGNAAPDRICASDPSVIDDAEVADALERFAGANLTSNVNANAGSVILSATSMDIDSDGDNDFAVGSGIIIADSNNSHCARITSVIGTTVGFTPDTPAGFAVSSTSGSVSPAVVYEVNGTDLLRNNRRLANGVEDLQLEFGVDANGDGQLTGAEFPIHDLNGQDPSEVRSLRLSVIARADREDEALETVGRPAAGNRNAGTADGFRRRRITATVVPRNLL